MVETILSIVLVGLKFLDRVDQDKIKSKILDLRTKYAEEIARQQRPIEPGEEITEDNRPIDNARVFSLERELRDILQLYSSAVQRTAAPTEP